MSKSKTRDRLYHSGASLTPGRKNIAKPEGLEAINKVCSQLYPHQPNPMQVSAVVKYWLGGPDPLDYITMYHNHGNPATASVKATPPHWHYITCGFSDLYGDGRVHERVTSADQPSGYGFELSFRVNSENEVPPTWPAELLQSLARYVFSSNNVLCVGDHISWHMPLDWEDSHIQHMLLAPDPQLPVIQSSFGYIQFIQVVGITTQELTAAQAWNGIGILKLMKESPVCGGELLITNMRRGESLFDVMPAARASVDEGVEIEGSLLSGVSTPCWWEEDGHEKLLESHMTMFSCSGLELTQTISLNKVHLKFNLEAIRLWPLAIRGRLNHGCHFTFKSIHGDVAITLVSAGVEGAFATAVSPLVAHGPWLQVYLSKEECRKIATNLDQLVHQMPASLPLSFEWSEVNIKITVIASEQAQ